MRDLRRPLSDRRRPGVLGWAALLALIFCALPPVKGVARERTPFEASAGLDIARTAALTWSHDAVLIYVENDEDLDPSGAAPRWGYLFHSPLLKKARVYSVREGRILVAENLEMKFEAPPLADTWIDSGAALRAADEGAGRDFCRKHGGRLKTMLLIRGAFSDKNPDQTTWTVVYSSAGSPSLFVVVDAKDGSVRRTWRG